MTSPDPEQTFAIPQQVPARSKPLRVKELRHWIETLPMANLERASLALTERLGELNCYALSPTDRSELLETLRDSADLLLREQEVRHSRPTQLTDKDRGLAAVAQGLRAALVVGYKILVQDLHGSWVSGHLLRRKMRVRALHRQIHYLGRILLADSQHYLPPTPRVWSELHRAYQYAEAARLQSKPVPNEDQEMVETSTIADQYKLWLLLALAGPYRLQQGQARLVYQLLQRWAPLCRLRSAAKRRSDAAGFAIDREADRPPVSAEQLPEGGFHGWYLDLVHLARAVQEYLDQLPVAPRLGAIRPAADLETRLPELLPRLLWSWGVRPTRAAPRESPGGSVTVLCGLAPIYRALLHRDSAEHAVTVPPTGDGRRVALDTRDSADDFDAWLRNGAVVEKIRLQGAGGTDPVWAHRREHGTGHQLHRCEIFDRSRGGYRLGVHEKSAACLRVGELLALREPTDVESDPAWQLASVRWIRRGAHGILEFGAQLFSGAVEPVGLERHRQGGGAPDRWEGLLLGTGSFEQETLITPAFYAEAESRFTLVQGQRKAPIQLVHAVEITPCFAQFRFAPLF